MCYRRGASVEQAYSARAVPGCQRTRLESGVAEELRLRGASDDGLVARRTSKVKAEEAGVEQVVRRTGAHVRHECRRDLGRCRRPEHGEVERCCTTDEHCGWPRSTWRHVVWI